MQILSTDPAVFRSRPDELFADDNIGKALELQEWTNPTDSYAAQYNVYAGYAMADVPVTSRLRVVVGERIESASQTIESFDPFSAASTRVRSRLARTDLLPSANVILKLAESTNLRLSATRTVARPQLRELAPFLFTEFFGAREILGNPNLDRIRIANFDARVEFFPAAGEVLALSVFHKRFEKPIETVILPTSRGVVSYQNAKSAVNTGIELEARKNLAFITQRLREFSVLSNVTLLHSNVELDASSIGIQTSNERPLAGQSPVVVNAALDWNHESSNTRVRALYNAYASRISQVGSNGLPDTYERPRHMVDLSVAQGIGKHIDIKATLENVLNAPVRFTQGSGDDAPLTNRFLTGQTFWLMGTYVH